MDSETALGIKLMTNAIRSATLIIILLENQRLDVEMIQTHGTEPLGQVEFN